jgi:bla regulator protein BlaR1
MSAPSRMQAQVQNTPATFAFEVASITPSSPDAPGGFMTTPGRGPLSDRYTAKNITLMSLLRAAYGIPLGAEDTRISGGPSWLRSAKYDVEAKIDSSMLDELKKLSLSQRTLAQQHMLQTLLADRCKLTIHRETRDLAIYTLVIAKNGSKLKPATPGEISAISFGPPGQTQSITGQARSVASLVQTLSVSVGRPVVDKTALSGEYDFKLEWTPDEGQPQTSPDDRPATEIGSTTSSIFTAIQEQLGLKMVSGKGPVEVIVIDHVEQPSAN